MKKKILAVALLSALSAPAFAKDDSGLYLVGMAGNTSNVKNVDNSTSFGGVIGYRFNSFFMVEGGMTMLVDNAKYQVAQTPVTVGGVTYTATSTTLGGSELTAVLGLPITEDFSVLIRLGYANLTRVNNPAPPEVEVSWTGSTTGLALQYLLPHEFSVNRSKMQIGLRAGVTKYNLKESTGLSETPSNTYVAGVIQF